MADTSNNPAWLDAEGDLRTRRRRKAQLLGSLLLLPAIGLLLGAFVTPILHLLGQSVETLDGAGYTADNFAKVLVDPLGQHILFSSVKISAYTTLVCLVLGFPLAYQAARSGPTLRNLIIVLVSFPLLTSAVVRTFGWQILMFPNGSIVMALRALGWERPPALIGTTAGVVIALAEIGLPFMVLTLFGVIRSIDESIEEAAQDLGDPPLLVWCRVTLPLCRNGLIGGALLVFAFAMSAYATPKLVGQSRILTLSQSIFEQSIVLVRYPVAAAFAVVLLVITIAVSLLSTRLVQTKRGLTS